MNDYQSIAINAQSLNGFHAKVGKRQKHGNPTPLYYATQVDNAYSIAGFMEILDWGPSHPISIGMGCSARLSMIFSAGDVSPRSAARLPLLSLV